MNKKELIHAIATETDITLTNAEKCLNAITNSINKALIRNEKVTLVGFGTFEARKRAPRFGRNLRTGEIVEIQPRRVVFFKAGKNLKYTVNPE